MARSTAVTGIGMELKNEEYSAAKYRIRTSALNNTAKAAFSLKEFISADFSNLLNLSLLMPAGVLLGSLTRVTVPGK